MNRGSPFGASSRFLICKTIIVMACMFEGAAGVTFELDTNCCILKLITKVAPNLPLMEFSMNEAVFWYDGHGGLFIKDNLNITHIQEGNFPLASVGPPAFVFNDATELYNQLDAWRTACCTPA